MKSCTRFVSPLTPDDKTALLHLREYGTASRQRQRAQAVLLSAKGYTLAQIADIFDTAPRTVSVWLGAWQTNGLDGLADAPKPGRRRALEAQVEAHLLELLQNPTPDLKAVVQAHLKKKASAPLGEPSNAP